jgi:prolyl oligopeptidase PreP (S9A serine peptidase family)
LRLHLGVMGGSNSSLLVGNMLTSYPELFGSAVCQVPLLDMRRYHEIGGAADNAQRAFMSSLAYRFLWRELGGLKP